MKRIDSIRIDQLPERFLIDLTTFFSPWTYMGRDPDTFLVFAYRRKDKAGRRSIWEKIIIDQGDDPPEYATHIVTHWREDIHQFRNGVTLIF